MWGCKDANRHTWTLEYGDARMCGCQQAHMNLGVWGCKVLGYTDEAEDIRKHGSETTREHSMYRCIQRIWYYSFIYIHY